MLLLSLLVSQVPKENRIMIDNRYTFLEGRDCSMREKSGDIFNHIENMIESRQIESDSYEWISINFHRYFSLYVFAK